jgi:hypothetical protein
VEGRVMGYKKTVPFNCHARTTSDIFTGFVEEFLRRDCSGNTLKCTLIDKNL